MVLRLKMKPYWMIRCHAQVGVHTHTLQCTSLARANPVRVSWTRERTNWLVRMPPRDHAVFNMFTYSTKRKVRITNAATRNWSAPLLQHPFGVYRSTLKLTQGTCFCDLYFFSKKKKEKPNQGLVLKITDVVYYLLILYVVFSFKCETGGSWLLLEESKAPCLQCFEGNWHI